MNRDKELADTLSLIMVEIIGRCDINASDDHPVPVAFRTLLRWHDQLEECVNILVGDKRRSGSVDSAPLAQSLTTNLSCACVHHDSRQCVAIRYGKPAAFMEACDCACHESEPEDDDEC